MGEGFAFFRWRALIRLLHFPSPEILCTVPIDWPDRCEWDALQVAYTPCPDG